jgi:hypothetical protein
VNTLIVRRAKSTMITTETPAVRYHGWTSLTSL